MCGWNFKKHFYLLHIQKTLFLDRKQASILLDEANHTYRKLDKSRGGQEILDCFVEFIHRNTKQDAHCSCIFVLSKQLIRKFMKKSIEIMWLLLEIYARNMLNKNTGSSWKSPKTMSTLLNGVWRSLRAVGGHMVDLKKICLSISPMEELAQMVAIAHSHMNSLKCPEHGESVAQGILRSRLHRELHTHTGGVEDAYGHDNYIDEMIKGHVVCYRPGPKWGDDLILPEKLMLSFLLSLHPPLNIYIC